MKIKNNKGIALVEVVIASSIILFVVVATSLAYNAYMQYALLNQKDIQANYLVEEGAESIYLLRDAGFTFKIKSLAVNTTYYLYFNGTSWVSTTSPQYVDGLFLRSFTIASTSRDSNDDITVSGTDDPNTKKVTINVAYQTKSSTTTKTISTYITNLNND